MSWIDIALGGLAVAFALAIVRAIKGPTVADRALAADLGLYTIVGSISLLALSTGSAQFLDVVLIATLLGFLATVALGAMIGRRRP